MEFENGVQFDPGFTAYISAIVPNINYIYGNINRYKNFGQKKNFFKMHCQKIEELLNTYIAFYLGCMLWADAVKTIKDKPILNNFICGEEYNEEETLYEVIFTTEYAKQFIKDMKYYAGKDIKIEDYKFDILNAYKEFLKVNKGFTKLSKTDDIELPDCIKELSETDAKTVIDNIEKILDKGDLTELYSMREMIL